MSASLVVREVYKSFGETQALRGVSLEVGQGEVVAVLGPSGCGKSTLLSLVAGLEAPDSGEISWEGASLREVPPHRRDFGLMFQDFALFPHMNVFDNVAFGLRIARMPGEQVRRRVAEMLELVGLTGFEERDVNTLSGGEQQRVALARSLAPLPRLLMLDEPLGSLDRTLRERLLLDLRQILRRIHQTAMYVTHDQEEAFTLADRVAVMNAGLVEQIGSPMEIYRRPATVFVARFLGLTNLLPGQASRRDGRVVVETPLGAIPAPEGVQGEVTVLFRPEEAALNGRGDFALEGRVVERSFRGSTCRMVIEANGVPLAFEFQTRADLPTEGEPIRLSFETGEGIQFMQEQS